MSGEDRFSFVAHCLAPGALFEAGGAYDDPKFHIVEFRGTVAFSEKDGISIDGNIMCKVPLVVRFNGMTAKDEGSSSENPEQSLDPGEHPIRFQGKVNKLLE